MKFSDLLSITVACERASSQTASLLFIGDAAKACADQLAASRSLMRESGAVRIVFGLSVLTLPYPILVNGLMTEHNARLDQLSLFGWIEDNAILEPRAEVFGLTPLAEDPVLFLRDLDLDRPPVCLIQVGERAWLRVAGVVIALAGYGGVPQELHGDYAALQALQVVLPPDALGLVQSLRTEVAAGKELRQVLRTRRRSTLPEWMALCDGWRVLSRAAVFVIAAADGISSRYCADRYSLR